MLLPIENPVASTHDCCVRKSILTIRPCPRSFAKAKTLQRSLDSQQQGQHRAWYTPDTSIYKEILFVAPRRSARLFVCRLHEWEERPHWKWLCRLCKDSKIPYEWSRKWMRSNHYMLNSSSTVSNTQQTHKRQDRESRRSYWRVLSTSTVRSIRVPTWSEWKSLAFTGPSFGVRRMMDMLTVFRDHTRRTRW